MLNVKFRQNSRAILNRVRLEYKFFILTENLTGLTTTKELHLEIKDTELI